MKVMDVMSTDVVTVGAATPLREVARLHVERRISGVPVVHGDGAVIGVVSEGDLLFKERGRSDRKGVLAWLLDEYGMEGLLKLEARTAGDAMTAPARTIAPWRTVSAAAAQMLEEHVNRLPVVEHGRLVGIVTRADLVRAFARTDGEIEHEIRELMKQMLPEPAAVGIKVDQGDVTLTGRLERRSDVDILTRLTERVPGVVSIASDVTWRGNDWKRR